MLKIKSRRHLLLMRQPEAHWIPYIKDSFVSIVTNLNNKTIMFIKTDVSYNISLCCRFFKKLVATARAV